MQVSSFLGLIRTDSKVASLWSDLMTPSAAPVLLRVDASPRLEPSVSRRIADAFEAAWIEGRRDGRVVHRDLALQAVPHLQAQTVVGFYTPPEALDDDLRRALVVSDTLIAELQRADTLLISTPMYNFTVPSVLKAWIDQVVRINSTFAYDGTGFSGLVRTRRAVVIAAHGLGGDGAESAGVDFLGPLLRAVFDLIGIKDVTVLSVENTSGPPEVAEPAVAAAIEAARRAAVA